MAGQLRTAGQASQDLKTYVGHLTDSVTSSIWTKGDGSEAFGAFGTNLAQGADTQGPFDQIATAVENYASVLESTQQQVRAYNSLAQAVQASGSGGGSLLAEAEQAGLTAMNGLQALDSAGNQTASTVTTAAGALDVQQLFGTSGPVSIWVGKQPLLGKDFLVPSDVVGPGDTPIPGADLLDPPVTEWGPDLVGPDIPEWGPDVIGPDIPELGPDMVGPNLPIPGDTGLPSLLGPLGQYNAASTPEDDGQPGDGGQGEPGEGIPGSVGGGTTEEGEPTGSWVNDPELDRTVTTPSGDSYEVLAVVNRDGDSVTVSDIAMYGSNGDLVNQVGPAELRSEGVQMLQEAREQGVNSITFEGVRVSTSSGKTGHEVNMTVSYGDDGKPHWSISRG